MNNIKNDFEVKGVHGQILTVTQVVNTPNGWWAALYVQNVTGGTPVRYVAEESVLVGGGLGGGGGSVAATANGTWRLPIPEPGKYQIQIWAEQNSAEIGFGETPQSELRLVGGLQSFPSARVANSTLLSNAQTILAALSAAILGQATEAQKMMVIGNMTVVNMSAMELLAYKRHFESEVARETGRRSSKVKVRMS